mgnify:FL=1
MGIRTVHRSLVVAYLGVILITLIAMMWRPTPPARPFLVELSLALAFVGLVQLALQFVLIARFERLSVSYGVDVILRFHRYVAMIALLFIVAHPIILVLHEPAMAALLNPLYNDWGVRTANWAIYALILLVLLSVLRKQLRLSYEAWRISHTLLGVATIVLSHVHVHISGRYTNVLWKELLLIAISTVAVALLVYVRLVRPAQLRRRPYLVSEVRPERGSVWSLALRPEGHGGMRFLPGQFGYLKLGSPYTIHEHPFSFSSSAEHTGQIEFAIKELGDFTDRIGSVPIGTVAFIDGPHGAFSTDLSQAPGYVLIAGGVGIAPLISMLRTLADRGDRRPVQLIYGEKRWEDVAFRDEIEELKERLSLDVVYTLDDPPEGWDGETGYVDAGLLRRHLPQEGFERNYFICGPNPMIDAVEAALAANDVPARLVHAERFDLV